MRIRHLVAIDNVDSAGFVIDPLLVRHGLIVGGRIAALAGVIEPLTHLNLDFPAHRLDRCLIVAQLEDSAPAIRDAERFCFAAARPSAYCHLGPVVESDRSASWAARLRTTYA